MPALAIAAYRCQVAGIPTESIDIQVRYFSTEQESEISEFLSNEKTHPYFNSDGELVEWPFIKVLSIEQFNNSLNGSEVAGFIASVSEFTSWSKNDF